MTSIQFSDPGAPTVRMDLHQYSPGVLLDERELAAAMHVSARTLQYWRQRDEGPPFLRLGRHVRYCVRDVVEWLELRRG